MFQENNLSNTLERLLHIVPNIWKGRYKPFDFMVFYAVYCVLSRLIMLSEKTVQSVTGADVGLYYGLLNVLFFAMDMWLSVGLWRSANKSPDDRWHAEAKLTAVLLPIILWAVL